MARLRVRLRFNPGRHGAPLDRLGEFSVQVEKFLRALSNDLGVKVKKGEWLAKNFKDSSVGFDSEYAGRVEPMVAHRGANVLRGLTSGNPLEPLNSGAITHGTMTEFSKIGEAMSPDDHFDVGIFETEEAEEPTEWKEVAYGQTAEIRQLLNAPYVSYGSVQGIMHGWVMEGDTSFSLRTLSNGLLVKCLYGESLHKKLHEATEKRGSILIVYGDMKWDVATNSIIEIETTDLEIERTLTDAEFDGLFGAAPEYVGSMTSAEYIAWLRGDTDGD